MVYIYLYGSKNLGSAWEGGIGSQVLATNSFLQIMSALCQLHHSYMCNKYSTLLSPFSQPHQLLPFTCHASTSHHQVLYILHFSTLIFLQTLSALLMPHHLPISTSNLAVPPLNFTRILLLLFHFTSAYCALHSFSINFPIFQ